MSNVEWRKEKIKMRSLPGNGMTVASRWQDE
jgi:hypothetical protein